MPLLQVVDLKKNLFNFSAVLPSTVNQKKLICGNIRQLAAKLVYTKSGWFTDFALLIPQPASMLLILVQATRDLNRSGFFVVAAVLSL